MYFEIFFTKYNVEYYLEFDDKIVIDRLRFPHRVFLVISFSNNNFKKFRERDMIEHAM